jgi:hypothetical protein
MPAAIIFANSVAKLLHSLSDGVAVETVTDAVYGHIFYLVRYVEVGLADAQVDRILKLGGEVEDFPDAGGVDHLHSVGNHVLFPNFFLTSIIFGKPAGL